MNTYAKNCHEDGLGEDDYCYECLAGNVANCVIFGGVDEGTDDEDEASYDEDLWPVEELATEAGRLTGHAGQGGPACAGHPHGGTNRRRAPGPHRHAIPIHDNDHPNPIDDEHDDEHQDLTDTRSRSTTTTTPTPIDDEHDDEHQDLTDTRSRSTTTTTPTRSTTIVMTTSGPAPPRNRVGPSQSQRQEQESESDEIEERLKVSEMHRSKRETHL